MITRNKDGSPQVSVVNCGIVIDPESRESCVGLVARQGQKLRNLRREPQATVVIRAGWEWIAVRGSVTIGSPDDPDDANAVLEARSGDIPLCRRSP